MREEKPDMPLLPGDPVQGRSRHIDGQNPEKEIKPGVVINHLLGGRRAVQRLDDSPCGQRYGQDNQKKNSELERGKKIKRVAENIFQHETDRGREGLEISSD